MTRHITSDGVGLNVIETGLPDAPVTVLLLHGWTQSHRTWEWTANVLPWTAGVPVRTIRYDLRGHGESDPAPPGTATIARCADDAAELIDARASSGPLVLAGHSMGGMTIMALAERHPALFQDRVRGVALVSTAARGLAEPSFGLPRPLAKLIQNALPSFEMFANPYLRPGVRWLLFGRGARSADVTVVADDLATGHPASIAGFRLSLGEHDRYAALSRLRAVPTVVLSGLADRLTPHRHSRRIANALPEAHLLVYTGAGHMLPFERREECTEHIARLVRTADNRLKEVNHDHGPRNPGRRPGGDRSAVAEVLGEDQL